MCLKKLGKFYGSRGGALHLIICLTLGRCCPNSRFFAVGYTRDNRRKDVFFIGSFCQFDTGVSAKSGPTKKMEDGHGIRRMQPADGGRDRRKGP